MPRKVHSFSSTPVAVAALLAVMATGCTFQAVDDTERSNGSAVVVDPPDEPSGDDSSPPTTQPPDDSSPPTTQPPDDNGQGDGVCGPHVSTLYGGQTYDAGTATVTNDGENLIVALETHDGWQIDAVSLYVGFGPVPTNPAGIPAIGSFPYQDEIRGTTETWELAIPLSELQAICGDVLTVAIHTDLKRYDENGDLVQTETGWAYGEDPFDGPRWGWSFPYEICCDEGDPDAGCTLTQGYWKNHYPDAWPEDLVEATLCTGDADVSWYDLLETPPRGGDAFIILAHQWIAAMLNVATGASDDEVADALDEAEALLDECAIAGGDRDRAIELADWLDAYNNGEIGPGHCDDASNDGNEAAEDGNDD